MVIREVLGLERGREGGGERVGVGMGVLKIEGEDGDCDEEGDGEKHQHGMYPTRGNPGERKKEREYERN